MVRNTILATSASCLILAVFQVLRISGFAGYSSIPEYQIVLLSGAAVLGWLSIRDICERGKFADGLRQIDMEAEHVEWPNFGQLLHATKIAMLLLAFFTLAVCCFDMIVSMVLAIGH